MNNQPTAEQIAKLPKWAQEHITSCVRRMATAEVTLRDYLDNQSPSLIYTRRGISERSFIQDDRVTFELAHGEITAALRNDILECNANYGSGSFLIRPWSSNVAHLMITP